MTTTLHHDEPRLADSAANTVTEVDTMVEALVRVIPADALLCKQEQSAWRHSVTAKRFEPLRESAPLLAVIAEGLHDSGYRQTTLSHRSTVTVAGDDTPLVPMGSTQETGQVLDAEFLRHLIANVAFQTRGARTWGPEIADVVLQHLEAAATALQSATRA